MVEITVICGNHENTTCDGVDVEKVCHGGPT